MERTRRPAIATVCLVLVLGTAACSGSGGSDVAQQGETTHETTDEFADGVTTTAVLRPVDEADLVGLLPEAADIGEGFAVVPVDGAPADGTGGDAPGADYWDAAVAEACPDLVDMASESAQVITVALAAEPITAVRVFADGNHRQVSVLATTDDDLFPMRDQIDALVVALNKCTTIRGTDPVTGYETSLKVRANPDSNYGDVGLVMSMDVAVTGGDLRGKARGSGNLRAFQYGAVTVAINTVDGFDPDTLRRVRVDADLSPDLAKRLNREIRELQDD